MNSVLQRILVVGGNGFVGSAVCKAAVARGIQVTSVSSSGRPYRTEKGHTPAWVNKTCKLPLALRSTVSLHTLVDFHKIGDECFACPVTVLHKCLKVDWQTGDALQPESFAHLFADVSGVVHTLGTLLEDADGTYKRAIRSGDVPGLLGSFLKNTVVGSQGGNPLEKHQQHSEKERSRGTYEVINRDTALRVCEAFISSESSSSAARNVPRPFVYVSAEDIFRPLIPARYIETKREAERGIETMMAKTTDYRGVYIRPSLIYHAHQRPITTPVAFLFDLSATLHARVPPNVPTPSGILRSLGNLLSSDGNGRGQAKGAVTGEIGDMEPKLYRGPSSPGSQNGPGTVTPSALEAMANALVIPPIHVDHVADAILASLDSTNGVRGVVGVSRMRELIGWRESGGKRESGGADVHRVQARPGP